MNDENIQLFVSCAPLLEPLLLDELRELGITSAQMGYRGVYISEWDWSTIYTINYASRLANRVLLPIKRFRCYDKRSLYRSVQEIDWSSYLKKDLTFSVDSTVHHRELRNSLFAAQVVKDAICDQLRDKKGWRPDVDLKDPDVHLNLYINQNVALISFDTSGTPLNKRGYRQETVEAPIQETLAAALLRLANYKKENVFLDTCCGSGTLLIEAALIASNTPPGYLRRNWTFMHHPSFQQEEWLKVKNNFDAQRIPLEPNHFYGLDNNPQAIRACQSNLKAAGITIAEIEQIDFRDFIPSVTPDFIMTNPPHGNRLEEVKNLGPFYRSLGDFIKQNCAKPGRAFIFVGSLELCKEVGLAASRRHVFNNGGIDSRLLEFEIYKKN